MISLAANGSPILKTLLDAETLPLDYVKCPLSGNSRAEVALFRPFHRVLLHGWGPVYAIGERSVPEPETLRELMAASGSPYLSTHLSAVPDDFDGPLTPDALTERTVKNVDALRALTGQAVLLENVPYFPGSRWPRFVTDPAFIREALQASGAKMLLDLAHAQVAAFHRGEELAGYLDALPLALVREVHLSRPQRDETGMRDRHLPLADDDYALLEAMLPRLPHLGMVALEYGGLGAPDDRERNNPNALREQIVRLRQLIDEANDAALL